MTLSIEISGVELSIRSCESLTLIRPNIILHCHISKKRFFKIKYNPNGSIKKYKARLVAPKFSQVHRIDYIKDFALIM